MEIWEQRVRKAPEAAGEAAGSAAGPPDAGRKTRAVGGGDDKMATATAKLALKTAEDVRLMMGFLLHNFISPTATPCVGLLKQTTISYEKKD